MSTNVEMSPLFLATEEVAMLTGYKLPGHQTKWLQAKGWRFELNGNRKPIIARKYAEKMLGCGGIEEPSRPQPNFNALRAA
jgi:hypothetical protein